MIFVETVVVIQPNYQQLMAGQDPFYGDMSLYSGTPGVSDASTGFYQPPAYNPTSNGTSNVPPYSSSGIVSNPPVSQEQDPNLYTQASMSSLEFGEGNSIMSRSVPNNPPQMEKKKDEYSLEEIPGP